MVAFIPSSTTIPLAKQIITKKPLSVLCTDYKYLVTFSYSFWSGKETGQKK